ncbi:MAG: preprotein translocase subunit Sec61beta [Candidatus Woesearchaeota archaeon]|jgi:preprotein translocase subunit Sec61beta|nr:preprotein translocase subunit Sec61beta [Candidatus Woesearchaeota archaeon]MDP6265245.1 preprotein translocase subunit Sec61beta [Candidatus Woesearchaeota archaeon]MDP7322801.1 preprotein translocase subunit Sec61beta [Candidatus Woesearchaeota archaeon]MDP7476484.1 preprotein translocase subunit Sec61beta [Candidatus Woesearchaeota archaeon]HJO01402.1 preprotein translocase subunit Sec61beta [Candidatus Woesearchaeota archaeon]|tara:strand:- start:1744 stop:1920 length:177 start_codon:yes stop_codon:yes gene_type:complete
MPQDNKIAMPSGMGGLMRYFDEYKSRIRIKPGHIIIMVVIVMAIMIFLYSYGNTLLGI